MLRSGFANRFHFAHLSWQRAGMGRRSGRDLRLNLAWLSVAALLSGCASNEGIVAETTGGASVNVSPANYRAEIIAYQRSYLNDPTGIRSAAISQPVLKNVGVGDRYVVCVRFNAKNPNGAYTGVRDHLAIFLAGKLDQMGLTRDQCKDAIYEPFPELERMTR
jgi:hypothetical protein